MVRSVTVTSIMFMMPMPPTTSAMDAMPTSSDIIIEVIRFMASVIDSMLMMV